MIRHAYHFLLTAWRYASALKHIPQAEPPEFWLKADAEALHSFLQTETGQKLQARLDNYAYKSAMAAVRQRGSQAYECGEAAGIQLGIAAMYEHQISHAQSDSEQTEDGNEAMPTLEQLAS